MKGGWLYFMTNRRDGILYAGVTSNLPSRAYQHREGVVKGFTKRYGLKHLVYYEYFDDIRDAIQREKMIKHWPRAWKVRLIHSMNPDWDDFVRYAHLTLLRSRHMRNSPSCPRLSRASTSFFCGHSKQDVDGRDKPGHDSVASHWANLWRSLLATAPDKTS
jgi:putative endonuclease